MPSTAPESVMKTIHVVAGVIYNTDKSAVFIAKRASDQHQGDLWEFPGGKVESGESVESALLRELNEEIGISIVEYRPLIKISHDYPDKSIVLDAWEIITFEGLPIGKEGQLTEWVDIDKLGTYSFPAANKLILEQIDQVTH